MELIPILSTIILVATISTFLLAVGAYILYKVRERKGEPVPYPKPSSVRAELVTPAESDYKRNEYTAPEEVRERVEPHYVKSNPEPGVYPAGQEYRRRYRPVEDEESPRSAHVRTKQKFLKYTSEGYVPTEQDKTTGVLKWR